MSSDNLEEEPQPVAVSALRSRFEKLAHEGSSSPTSPAPKRPVVLTSTLLRNTDADRLSPATRQRAVSINDSHSDVSSPAPQHLRSASSSSDLKISKRPPPPPPPRSPKPTASPIVMTTEALNDPAPLIHKPSLIARKPPPPPAVSQAEEGVEASGLPTGGVASLRNKFATSGVAVPGSPSTRHIQVPGNRVVSHSSAMSSSRTLQGHESSSHQPRHSISSIPDSNPLITFDDAEEHKPAAPPLPSRQPSNPFDSDSSNQTSRASSQESSASSRTSPELLQRPPPSPSKRLSPRPPPPRHSSLPLAAIETGTASHPDNQESSSSSSSTPTLQIPPPLPARRSPPNSVKELPGYGRPPSRANSLYEMDTHEGLHSAPPTMERKPQFAPPPVRTIGLGDKLPPPRRPPSNEGSESEEAEEEEGTAKGGRPGDLLPDATHSSRRPPLPSLPELARARLPVTAHSGVIAVAGARVVIAHHHIKVYDLGHSDSYIHNVDLKEAGYDWRGKEPRVTSMEFRSADIESERGRFVWLGTKDGTIWELDTHSGGVSALRPAAHGACVTHIFRHGLNMVSLDENGKVLVFAPDPDTGGCATMLTLSAPRVVRITEKQGFAKILGGLLWTSGGPGSSAAAHANGGAAARGPYVRVHDIFAHSASGKPLLALEHVGAVTSGTILQSQPGKVFLGHEGGFITIWDLNGEEGMPACAEVVKISASDILSLEGVGERLWAGGRKGMIYAYDIQSKPWIVTNNWMAHSELPVQKLFIDPFSIEKCGQLSVISVGRDEQARFWDGLLGGDWIDNELLKRESSFSSFRPLNVLIVSWNVDAAKPDALNGCPENFNFLENVLNSVDSPDIIAFGFQELIDLESRKMAAKTVLLGGKKKAADGSISEKVSRSYKMWHDRLILAVRLAMPPDCPYTVVHAENLVGLFTCIFIKSSERKGLKDVAITTVKRGIAGMYGNKGGIVARLVIDDSSICFINCHLAAGQNHIRARNADVAAVLEDKQVFPPSSSYLDPISYAGGGDGTMVLDHEIVFLNGDLNYRIDQRRDATISAIHAGQIELLLSHDQLLKEMRFNRGFRLRSFVEAPITFAPTYKYDRRSSDYDTSEKSRAPAWCDRILYRTRDPERVQNLHYQRYEANVSDHRPISAAFRITVKSVDHDVRAHVKSEVETLWLEQQLSLLSQARAFFVEQAIL